MWELAKKLDPTRLVEDMSVCHWEHLEYYLHCDTDINSWHFYINDYDKAKAHIDKIVSSTFVGSSFNYVPGFLHKGQPLINSEYGGIGALDGDRDVSWSFKFLTNELRRHQQIAAYIYTELHDVEWEYNGFLNYDRTPKEFGYDPRIINESNTLPIDAPPIARDGAGRDRAAGRRPRRISRHAPIKMCRCTGRWAAWIPAGAFHQDLALRARADSVSAPPGGAGAHARIANARRTDALHPAAVGAHRRRHTVARKISSTIFVSGGYPPDREETAARAGLARPAGQLGAGGMERRHRRTRESARGRLLLRVRPRLFRMGTAAGRRGPVQGPAREGASAKLPRIASMPANRRGYFSDDAANFLERCAGVSRRACAIIRMMRAGC